MVNINLTVAIVGTFVVVKGLSITSDRRRHINLLVPRPRRPHFSCGHKNLRQSYVVLNSL